MYTYWFFVIFSVILVLFQKQIYCCLKSIPVFWYNDIIVLIIYILLFLLIFFMWHFITLFLICRMWTGKFYSFKGCSTRSFSHWLSYCLTCSLKINSKPLTQTTFLNIFIFLLNHLHGLCILAFLYLNPVRN